MKSPFLLKITNHLNIILGIACYFITFEFTCTLNLRFTIVYPISKDKEIQQLLNFPGPPKSVPNVPFHATSDPQGIVNKCQLFGSFKTYAKFM